MNSPFFASSENSTSNVNVYTFVISLYRYLRYASKFTFDINAFNKLYSKKDNFFSFLVTTVQGGGGIFYATRISYLNVLVFVHLFASMKKKISL